MRSSITALNLLSQSLAGFTAAALVGVVGSTTDWLPPKGGEDQSLNEARLDLYYLLQAGVMVLCLL